jgi:hypothetical protein
LPEAARGPAVVRNPPMFAAGPFSTRARTKREAAQANKRHGGPGFLVADRDGALTGAPHAYFAEQSSTGEWYAVLKEMPSGHMAPL